MGDWQRLQREQPEVFAAYVELERRKPPTAEAGVKMSITGFKMLKKPPRRPSALVMVDNHGRHYRAPPLDVDVQGTAKPSAKPRTVCGAALRETKEVGCGWLDDAA